MMRVGTLIITLLLGVLLEKSHQLFWTSLATEEFLLNDDIAEANGNVPKVDSTTRIQHSTSTGTGDSIESSNKNNEKELNPDPELVDTTIPSDTQFTVPGVDVETSKTDKDIAEEEGSTKLSEGGVENVNVASDSLKSLPDGEKSDNGNGLASETNSQAEVNSTTATIPTADVNDSIVKVQYEELPSFMEWTKKKQAELNAQQPPYVSSGTHEGSNNIGSQNGHQNGNQQNGSPHVKNVSSGTLTVSSSKEENERTKNFASPDCGAKVIQANREAQNPNGILSPSHDEYMLNRCSFPSWFVIELCEPLKIEKVSLGNLELFSSLPKELDIGISDRFPTREWVKLGPFILPDVRSIHSITLPSTNSSTFGKYLKINISSHYGNEHYCPLSLVKVTGKSEYDVLESENIQDGDAAGVEKEENSVYEEGLINSDDVKSNDRSVFGSATDAVLDIVKKAAQAFGNGNSGPSAPVEKSVQASRIFATEMLTSTCQSLTQCLPPIPDDLDLQQKIYSLLACNGSTLLSFVNSNSPWCGWDYCHVTFSKQSIGLPWQPEGFLANIFGGPYVLQALCHYRIPITGECTDSLLLPQANVANKSQHASVMPNDNIVPKMSENESYPGTDSSEMLNGQQVFPSKEQPNILTSESTESQVNSTQIPSSQVVQQSQQNGVSDSNLQTEEINQQAIPVAPSPQQQKESVFLRLSNRIKTLERNQTLTASYLEELSRRFNKHNEENSHLSDALRRQMNDTRGKTREIEALNRRELLSLRRNLADIRERLYYVHVQRGWLVIICVSQFFFSIFGIIWIKRILSQMDAKISEKEADKQVVSSPVKKNAECSPIQGINVSTRKRSNSDVAAGFVPVKQKIKKKKKNLVESKSTSHISDATSQGFIFKPAIVATLPLLSSQKDNTSPLISKRHSVDLEPQKTFNPNSENIPIRRPIKPRGNLTISSSSFNPEKSRYGPLASPGLEDVFAYGDSPAIPLATSSLNAKPVANSLYSSSASDRSSASSLNTVSYGNQPSQEKKKSKKTLKSLMPHIFDRAV